jgi:hypothetical protein
MGKKIKALSRQIVPQPAGTEENCGDTSVMVVFLQVEF